MLSKPKIKWIHSLELKKNRDEENLFIAEGIKIVADLLPFIQCRFLAVSSDAIEIISEEEYSKITLQKSPQGVLAVFEKPESLWSVDDICNQLCLALDDVQDPGNMGTIIRLADWFGIEHVFCSVHSADVYNPKTIQATMGAIARVKVHYVDLADFLKTVSGKVPIYGTFMDGENIYEKQLNNKAIIVMGNEGNGISADIEALVSEKLLIPGFPQGGIT
ncbi:MAG: tRNA/rRNA methyltransferase (SpoU), partial [Bacteroidetes bacterium]|nr:tRNA/rRNA methyltransferase (SpoU) [Bacteroidota bacterium]